MDEGEEGRGWMTNNSDEEDTTSTSEAEEVVCFYYNSTGRKAPNNVTKVIVGPHVICINEKAFKSYEFLKEVDMSEALSLETIEMEAFAFCEALAIIVWPPNLKTIGEGAFRETFCECTIRLTEVDMSKLHALETIGDSAFAGCEALALVKWAPNLKTIGVSAFECTSLKEADLSQLHALETIGDCAFAWCSGLAIIKWASNLKTIGEGAFYQCGSLKEADLSQLHASETIEDCAFARCGVLDLVKFAPNLKNINEFAFHCCESLTEVDLSQLHALETIEL